MSKTKTVNPEKYRHDPSHPPVPPLPPSPPPAPSRPLFEHKKLTRRNDPCRPGKPGCGRK